MNRGRGETGSLVAGLGGVLLLVSLWLGWYKLANFTVTAWTAFEVWDLVLAALALAAIVTAATHAGWYQGPTHAIGLVVLGASALVIVGSQLIDPPPSVLRAEIGDGGWLALVGAILMAAGALMAESRVAISFGTAGPRGPGGGTVWRGRSRGAVDVPPPGGAAGVPLGRGARGPGAVRPAAPGSEDDPGYDRPPRV